MLIRTLSLTAVALLAATAQSSSASILGPADGYNVFVFGNMNQSSDSEGALAIGGNATLSNYSVATKAAANNTNLIVGGNLTATGGTINGSAFVGGNANYNTPTVNGSITANGNINFGTSGGSVSGTSSYGGTYTGPSYIPHTHISSPVSSPINFAAAQLTLDSTADGLASLSSNGATSIQWGAVTFTGTDAAANIFNISAQQLSQANGITINIPTGSAALINVLGSGAINLPNVGFNFDASRTLWNLDGFTAVTTSSFSGSVLAPSANVTFNSGAFNGTLIADSVTGGGQFNSFAFTGDFNIPIGSASPSLGVPEPASLSVPALGSLALLRRRRNA